jgi:hypothetical protein
MSPLMEPFSQVIELERRRHVLRICDPSYHAAGSESRDRAGRHRYQLHASGRAAPP